MITVETLNPNRYHPTQDQLANLSKLAFAVSTIEYSYIKQGGREFIVTSGLRSVADQERVNPSVRLSAHIEGLACDIADLDKKIWAFCVDNLEAIIELELYLEDKLWTPRHVHFQLRPPASGKRIFHP
jgi:hypothetical protein